MWPAEAVALLVDGAALLVEPTVFPVNTEVCDVLREVHEPRLFGGGTLDGRANV